MMATTAERTTAEMVAKPSGPRQTTQRQQVSCDRETVAMRGAVVESSHLVKVSSGHFSRRGNNWLALAVAVVVGSALLASLANLPNKHPQIQLAEAKTHHSKRQAPQQATAASPFTGRENTNWWNVWWQRKSQQPVDSYDRLGADQEIEPQTHHSPSNSLTRNAEYIQEAERPTVRPIVSVSYGDQSLRLAGQDPFADELDRTNMVPVRDSDQLDAANIEHLMQNERLRQEAPFGAKPTLLAHKKSMQHQAHWQSVKPTIIQPRATRQPTTRQAEPELTYGIQMRNSRNQVQQQQMVDDVRFEQQQNQMLDYTEEAELEPSSESPVAPNNEEAGARSTGVDSSSSSMMSEPERRPTTGTQRTTQQRPVQATSTTRANEPTISTSSSPATEETGQAANETPATSTTQTPVSTTTAAPSTMDQTTAKTLATTTTTTASNETPSPAPRDSVSATTTTPPARVQLQNGRPANGMRQVGVTSAARIPTISSGQQQPTTTPPSTTNTTPTTTTLAPTTVASTSRAQPTTTRAPATTTVGDESEAKSTSAQGETTGASTTVAAKAQTDSTATKGEASTVATPAETSEETNEDSSSAGSTPAANAGSTETETGDTDDEEEDEDNSNAGGEEVTTDATPANATTTTTQTPTPASVELTRLPKVGQQTAATPTSMNLMREASSMVQQEGSQPSGDIVRIRPPVGTGRMPVGEETAITMPMDTLLNMMSQANEESDPATQSTTAPKTPSGFGERTTMTGGQDSATTRRRLQPPPTTQMPNLQPMKMSIPAQTSLIDAPGQSPDAPLPKMVMVSVQSPTDVAPASDDGRTEMLNLDLMPIQRIMNNQMMAMRKEQPQGEMNKQPEAEQEQQVDREAPVEPGMRLRPPKTQPQRQQQQPAIVMGNQKDGQANTVYMVMMGGSQSTSTDEIKRPKPPVPMTTQAQMVQTPTTLAPSTTLGQQRERLMTTKSAPATTLQTTRRQPLSTTPNVPTTTGAVTTTTRRGEQPTMTTLSGQFSRTQPTSTMSIAITTNAVRGTTSQAATMTTTARPRFAETMMSMSMTEMEIKRQREQVEGMRGRLAMSGSEQQTSGPMTTTKSAKLQQTATTTAELMSTTQKSPATTTQSANGQNLIASKDTTATRQPETTTAVTTSAPTTTTTTPPAITTPTTTLAPTTTTIIVTSSTRESNQSAAPTTTNAQQLQPTSTTVKQLDNVTTTNPTTAPQLSFNQTTTTTKPTTSGVQQQTSTTTITTTTTTTTTQRPDSRQQSTDGEVAGSGDGIQLDKIQQQPSTTTPPQVQRPKGAIKSAAKTGKVGRQSNQTSSSFIPSKLRTDFNRLNRTKTGDERQSVSTTTQSPLTGMAIRQFGGANRMSLLGNQPVPFGRPAAMTMHSASPSRLQVGTNYRVELPSFEYGPSIAVRRPDEPLANGQVPNCTLTGKNFCVLTKDYPMNEVRQAVERSFRSVRIMYEELQTVSDQELHKEDFNVTNNQAASGRFACQTQMEMMRPGWAKDEITKEWMLVVNTDVFPQRVRTESCAQPNTPCEFIAPFYDSTCQQRYSLHRLIAIDPHDPSRSPQVAVFRFPAGCVCRVHPIRKTTTTTPASRR